MVMVVVMVVAMVMVMMHLVIWMPWAVWVWLRMPVRKKGWPHTLDQVGEGGSSGVMVKNRLSLKISV